MRRHMWAEAACFSAIMVTVFAVFAGCTMGSKGTDGSIGFRQVSSWELFMANKRNQDGTNGSGIWISSQPLEDWLKGKETFDDETTLAEGDDIVDPASVERRLPVK